MCVAQVFDDGARRTPAPLLTAVAASNEGPESEELAALYDRFLLRKTVRPLSDDGLLQMLLEAEGQAMKAEEVAEEAEAVKEAEMAAEAAEAAYQRGVLEAEAREARTELAAIAQELRTLQDRDARQAMPKIAIVV